MVEVKKHYLPATKLIPNSPHPLLHYPNFLSDTSRSPDHIHELFDSNGWDTQWIFRYGPTQRSHYHSATHECMAVLTGTATIRFGVADTSEDMDQNTHGSDREAGGVEVNAKAGDVFVIPAGVSHKTYNATPVDEFKLLTPGDGHSVAGSDTKQTLKDVELTGFTMIGAYPRNAGEWDFPTGGEDEGKFEQVWAVPKPDRDPVIGAAPEGVCGQWK